MPSPFCVICIFVDFTEKLGYNGNMQLMRLLLWGPVYEKSISKSFVLNVMLID